MAAQNERCMKRTIITFTILYIMAYIFLYLTFLLDLPMTDALLALFYYTVSVGVIQMLVWWGGGLVPPDQK